MRADVYTVKAADTVPASVIPVVAAFPACSVSTSAIRPQPELRNSTSDQSLGDSRGPVCYVKSDGSEVELSRSHLERPQIERNSHARKLHSVESELPVTQNCMRSATGSSGVTSLSQSSQSGNLVCAAKGSARWCARRFSGYVIAVGFLGRRVCRRLIVLGLELRRLCLCGRGCKHFRGSGL